MRVQRDRRRFTVEVSADGDGLVSHAGSGLLAELADRSGLTSALSRGLARVRERRSGHDPGRVVRDLAVMLADGGDCLADPARAARPGVAVRPGRLRLDGLPSDRADRLRARADRGAALGARRRPRADVAGGWPPGADRDRPRRDARHGALREGGRGGHVQARLRLASAAGVPRRVCGAVGRDAQAGQRRRDTACDQIAVAGAALEQLPRGTVEEADILLRADSAGATHELLDWARAGRIRFSVGFDITEPVRQAILSLPESAFRAAVGQDGDDRDGAWVAEITDRLDLSGWPEGARAIVRRERPHPGAQLSFTDHGGHRFQVTLTDQQGSDIAEIERRHRARANVEDRIRNAKQTGLDKLPFRDFEHNAVWLELVLLAQDLLPAARARRRARPLRAQAPALSAPARRRPSRLPRPAPTLRLQRNWPWAGELAAAFERLRALPLPAT